MYYNAGFKCAVREICDAVGKVNVFQALAVCKCRRFNKDKRIGKFYAFKRYAVHKGISAYALQIKPCMQVFN